MQQWSYLAVLLVKIYLKFKYYFTVIFVIFVGGMIIQSEENDGRLTIGKIASFMISALNLSSSISSLTQAYS